MGAAKAAPPTLRDLLELACESSRSEGFRSHPRRLPWHGDDHDGAPQTQAKSAETARVRLIIEAGLRRSPSRTLSSILFPRSPRSLAAVSRLTRSLSRRLAFWRWRRRGGADAGAGERDSLGLPSPVVSSCSASECSEPLAEAADLLQEQAPGASDRSEKPPPLSSGGVDDTGDGAADADADGHKAVEGEPAGSGVESMEDKQQLSPVSVMDFPFHQRHHHDDVEEGDDERSDAGTCSPSFLLQCQPDLERPKHEPRRKIRRLDGSMAQLAAVDPVDLEPRFVASDDSGLESVSDDTRQIQSDSSSSTASTDRDSAATRTTSTTTPSSDSDERHRSADDAEREPDEHRLLARLLKDDGGAAAAPAAAAERLLLDFFAEGLGRCRSLTAGPVLGTVKPSSDGGDEGKLLRAAKEWVQGGGTRWGVEDVLFAGETALADMDRERRWACAGEEEQEVGAAVEELLMDALLAELVRDMSTRC